jgi:hypothetical protein
VCGWVEWLLAKDPADRPQSAAQAWDALEEVAVAEMGPYWRRNSAISAPEPPPPREPGPEPPTTEEASEDPTRKLPTPTPIAPPVRVEPARRSRRAAGIAIATAVAGAAALAAFVVPDDREPESRPAQSHSPSAAPSARAVTPYDFDGDGRQELVMALLRGSPRGRSTRSGVVLVQQRAGETPWNLVSETRAGLPGRPRAGDDFGSGLASGDFDRDGHADLAIGTPGRERVSVLYGAEGKLDEDRTQQLTGGAAHLPAGTGRYGWVLAARDLDGDGYDDLAVGAPGERDGQPRSGALHVVFGGSGGLQTDRTVVIRRPTPGMSGFGMRLRAGDVDGDGRPDLVEGAPSRGSATGHLTYCRSGRRGPRRCRVVSSATSSSGLAVGDVTGDGRADIFQGDSQHVDPADGPPVGAGLVRVWFGAPGGPRAKPITISQDTPTVSGMSEPGDEFGAVVETGDLDSDGFADMVVGAVGENEGAGAVFVIRGHHRGYARVANSAFDQDHPSVPGQAAPDREFGSTLSVLRLSPDRRPDLALAVRGEDSADERVMVVQGGPGVFAPDETRTGTLHGVASQVHAPAGGRIRLAKTAGT